MPTKMAVHGMTGASSGASNGVTNGHHPVASKSINGTNGTNGHKSNGKNGVNSHRDHQPTTKGTNGANGANNLNGSKEEPLYNPHFTARVIAATGPNANPRMAEIMPSLLKHLHDFAREVHLTVGEWMAGVEFVCFYFSSKLVLASLKQETEPRQIMVVGVKVEGRMREDERWKGLRK
jgi:hypothetical protein